MTSILVMGLGNTLLSDEGVGVAVVGELERRFAPDRRVTFLDGGCSSMDVMDQVADHAALVVVDSIASSEPPGTVRVFSGEAVPAFFQQRMSPHQMGLADMLASLRLIDCEVKEIVLVGIVPQSLELGLDLTETCAAAVEVAVEAVADQIARLGVSLRPAVAAAA